MKPLAKDIRCPKILVMSTVMSMWLVTCDSKFAIPMYLMCRLEHHLGSIIKEIKYSIHIEEK